MTRYKPLLMGAAAGDPRIDYSMQELRGIFSAVLVGEGVRLPGEFKVSPRSGGANLSVDVSAGWAVISGDTQLSQGKYAVLSDAVENVPTPAAPGSGTRRHLLYLQIRDRKMDGGDFYDWTLAWGVDAGSGRPATPPSAIPLAEVAISAGQPSIQAANIIDLRPYVQSVGSAGDVRGFQSGTTDSQGYILITHSLGRVPVGGVATWSHPAPLTGSQAMVVAVDMTTANSTTVRARIWTPGVGFGVWPSKPANFSYILW